MSGRVKKAPAPRKKANGYKMPAPIATGEVIHDTIGKKKWRIGPSIGVGGFGEIYSACDHESSSKGSNFPFVVKIEPHENGPLFVEKHFYVRNANKDDIAKFTKNKKVSSVGMPTYYGNGSHDYKGEKYRYLVLERYGKDLWTLFKDCGRSFPGTTVFQIGLQMLDVLEYIHSRGYVHADIKGANILLGLKKGTENQAYLVDFGLATRVNDKEFKPDPKCAHNGTIEYTSRDAHLGVATMRGDLEILGYNMLQWLVGELPWEKSLKTPKTVQDMKEAFMKNVRANITKLGTVPDALIKYFEYINTLKPKDVPDYTKCCNLFESYLKGQGKTRNSKLEFTSGKNRKTSKGKVVVEPSESEEEDAPLKLDKKRSQRENGDVKKIKRGRPAKVIVKDSESESENCENETPNGSIESTRKLVKKTKVVRSTKRKSVEPLLSGKKAKLTPKPTPPIKKNHVNMATQTSGQKTRKSPRQVSFDSPICEIIGDRKAEKVSKKSDANTSRDIFEDSPEMVPRRKLISDEKVTVKRVVKKKTTIVKAKPRSWKDVSTIVNGRATPS